MTKKKSVVARIETGVRNLDEVFAGGIPKGSVVVIAGPPGSGKTILSQQICFHNVSAKARVLYFSTLSEPTAKTLRYVNQFDFFDASQIDNGMHFVDLGVILRADGLEESAQLIMAELKRVRPAIVVIDSFKVFDDLAKSRGELRKFGYELAVNLMAWETTTFLLGEYGDDDINTNPLFSIVDGLITATQREHSGEQQRFLQAVKMRGTQHSRDEHPFVITSKGIEVFAPRVTIQREDRGPGNARCKTLVSKLDDLMGEGIPLGSSLLIGGVAGTGKTILLLEFLYRGALAGEKGIIFSFEETSERLLAAAKGLGWDLGKQVQRGMVEIVFIPQPNIMVEQHLLMICERIERLKARRVAIDSVSVFLHKVKDPQVAREKVFQLASIVQNTQAVGFFATDIPYGSNQLSRFGVEETVVDGVVLLSSVEEGLERQRYIDVYKLRNTAHLKGRHSMLIGPGGLTIFPRYERRVERGEASNTATVRRRIDSGVAGLDPLLGGGLLEKSATLVYGSAGIGKSTLGLQFILEGVRNKEPGLFVSLEELGEQVLSSAVSLELPIQKAMRGGLCEVLYLPRESARGGQLLTLLTDKIRAQGTRRLVLDGLNDIVRGEATDDVLQLLFALVDLFKSQGVTCLLTLELPAISESEAIAERGYSPVTDNIVVMRYLRQPGRFCPTISVVKTRGSAHDRGIYHFSLEEGGIQIGARVGEDAAAAPAQPKAAARATKKPKPGRRR